MPALNDGGRAVLTLSTRVRDYQVPRINEVVPEGRDPSNLLPAYYNLCIPEL